jgi:hypoxanthine phosphoribosyltransferase
MAQSKWVPDYIVGITRGGLNPAVMLSQYLNVPLNTLKISLRDADENGCESNLWMSEDAFGYDKVPMKILVVDDKVAVSHKAIDGTRHGIIMLSLQLL